MNLRRIRSGIRGSWLFLTMRTVDVAATSPTLATDPTLNALLDTKPRYFGGKGPLRARMIVGWGYKASGQKVMKFKHQAEDYGILEDGFLRSVGRRDDAFSIVFDRDGIYYDARSDSRLFTLIQRPLSEPEKARAKAICSAWRSSRISKYNDGTSPSFAVPERYVLVIDQVREDLSISFGLADEDTFRSMLDAALAQNPDCTVLVKIHPDSVEKPEKRHFDIERLKEDSRIFVVSEPCHVVDLIEQAEAVYTATSQVGFEALIWGKPVRCFGMPFYAGWGLTEDMLERPMGREDVPLEQLVHAALVDYPRYWNPVLQQEGSVEEIIALTALNRDLRLALPETIYAMGFSRWKKSFLRDFLSRSEVHFVDHIEEVPHGGALVVWGNASHAEDRPDLTVLRAEDGFLRSSGLGADLVRPFSLVIDDVGIYYDATSPSRLEDILVERDFSEEDRRRGRALRERIVSAGINKYNLGGQEWHRPEGKERVLLVVGQVESDASIRFGSPEVKSNLELLRRVRNSCPDAYILYKPHPDVVAGLREAGSDESQASEICDEVLIDMDSNRLLTQVDEVHTMTSLLGFEALLRGVPVTCYGLPFYAGWGLTRDRIVSERRSRRLELDELVYATLVEYARYFSPRGKLFAQPEDILLELAEIAAAKPATRSLPRKLLRWGIVTANKLRGRK